MKLSALVVVGVISFFTLDFVKSQFDPCNFSRLDVSPCTFPMPGPNDYSIFSTRLDEGGSGALTCRVRGGRTETAEIVDLGVPTLRILFSPGFLLDPPKRYGNQQLVVFNVVCGEDERVYFRLTDLTIEPPNCFNPISQSNRCQDYVQVIDSSGLVESCGTESGDNGERLLDNTFTVQFRSSDSQRGVGFRGYAVCYRPDLVNATGCTRPQEDSEMNSTEPTSRRKRDLEDFHNQWRLRLHRMRRQGGQLRFERFNILNGEVVRYQDNRIVIEAVDPVRTIEFDDVVFLHTFDVNGTVDGFFKESNFEFRGPGPMVILGEYAYFQLFAIDPRGVIPTEAEAMLIGNLTDAQLDLVGPEDDIDLPDEVLEPPPPNFDELLGNLLGRRKRRRKRQTSEDGFSDDVVRIAIQNELACNPVLRAQSQGILGLVDDDRENMLRDELTATTAPPTTQGTTAPPTTQGTTAPPTTQGTTETEGIPTDGIGES